MLAFVGPPEPGQEVRHFPDRDPSNCALSNLSYGTKSENSLDKRRHGTDHNSSKTHCPRKHALEGANLRPYSLKRGKRVCLACARAAYVKAKNPDIDMQCVSDEKFLELTRIEEK